MRFAATLNPRSRTSTFRPLDLPEALMDFTRLHVRKGCRYRTSLVQSKHRTGQLEELAPTGARATGLNCLASENVDGLDSGRPGVLKALSHLELNEQPVIGGRPGMRLDVLEYFQLASALDPEPKRAMRLIFPESR